MDLASIATGAGSGTLVMGALYLLKLAIDARREHHNGIRTDKSSAVTDAATANATLVKAVETLQAENGRMAKKILHLEEEAEIKDRKIDDLEDRLNGAVRQVAEIASELSDLKAGR